MQVTIQTKTTKQHPAAEWAGEQDFPPTEVDCTTTVVLKILDNKCKMLPGEKAAIMEIYDVVQNGTGVLFGTEELQIIDKARQEPDESIMLRIHELRVYAEANIPKPVMKKYKTMLREGLFG